MEEKNLRIWLIKEGESALPIGEEPVKLMRTGALAQYLAEEGHQVTWWSSGFIHGTKQYLFHEYRELQIGERERLILLHSPIFYKKNVSLQRVLYHEILAKQFFRKAKAEEKPDVIVCCYPTMPFAKAAIRYGKVHHIPVILDVRDMWPDIFERVFPEALRPMSRLFLWPLRRSARKIFQAADALVGVVPIALDWALAYAGRKKSNRDSVIYIGCNRAVLSPEQMERELQFWSELGVTKETWNLCFISTLSDKSVGSDLETVIAAVNEIYQQNPDVRLIVGGTGDAYERLCKLTENMPAIVMAGWLNQSQMVSLMSISKCGVYCMRNEAGFKNAFGNKASQYLSAGLPILTSLTGFPKKCLEQNHCGIVYREGDIEDCAKKILHLYSCAQERREMASSAMRLFQEEFEFSIVNRKFEKCIIKNSGQGEEN